MIPPRIQRGDPIGKLVDYWNILIDHLNEIRLVSGKGISISKMPSGTVINALNYIKTAVAGPITAVGYNGYFTCKVLPQNKDDIEENKLRVAVCDGETWDPDKQSSLPSRYRVNDVEKKYPSVIIECSRQKPYIVFQYQTDDVVKVVALSEAELNKDLPKVYHYIIAELSNEEGYGHDQSIRIIQRHTAQLNNGIINFWTASDVCSWVYKDENEQEGTDEQ